MGIYEELQARGLIAQVTDEEEIRELINNGKATFYIGFDPTADSLHVGHFMALCLMKRLQEAGNRPIALIGGGTGYIGDPSGRSDMRSMMTPEQIQHNCDCFKKQMSRFIDFSEGKALMVNNADWLLDLNYIDLLREVGPHFSVNRMLTAECYKQRMEKGLSFLEFNYMIMQSYDFYVLYQKYGCNMQFGGDDQWSNMLGGTELIRRKLGKNACAMTITLLLNSEGKKMGKTQSGAVWLDPDKTSPFEFYQYWRNVADADVLKCIRMLTFLPLEEIDKMDSWEGAQLNTAKEILAYELTKLVHGEEEAKKAQDSARALFSQGDAANMPTTTLTEEDLEDGCLDILTMLVKAELVPSKSEARRAVQQGGVSVDGEKITNIHEVFTEDAFKAGIVLKKGKKNFRKIVME
ncbi:tyrosine--tRNA ligase [Faecalicatena contorta]|uniref:Tyrosine--tRNA ligase n=1 Tax=Faecalicatena fissicatena TaxID=290055 RepID=A0ABS2EC60_9FIRM|nr:MULTISPECIES: tyrosine--tRNA ligase [Clostridia]MBM6684974.1 tyrosine--tRNA ligase [Faecalicatena contorta]MBM6710502.1 tyrosine--tRNA ligase [Faecalicatena contorta]MBM6739135.1 tyrosine--tRNA ligase [Faecalicatena fissicatena]